MPPPASKLFIRRCAPARALGGRYLVKRPPCPRRYIERISETERKPLTAGPGDHCTVVRTQIRRGYDERGTDFKSKAVEHLSDSLVCGDAACGNQRARSPEACTEKHQTGTQPIEHNLDNRLLEARTEISDVFVAKRSDFFSFQSQRGFESGERKISVFAPMHGPRKIKARWVAAKSLSFYLRSTWITEAEQLCGFVEGLANGIILRCAKSDVITNTAHSHYLCVTAGGEE